MTHILYDYLPIISTSDGINFYMEDGNEIGQTCNKTKQTIQENPGYRAL